MTEAISVDVEAVTNFGFYFILFLHFDLLRQLRVLKDRCFLRGESHLFLSIPSLAQTGQMSRVK